MTLRFKLLGNWCRRGQDNPNDNLWDCHHPLCVTPLHAICNRKLSACGGILPNWFCLNEYCAYFVRPPSVSSSYTPLSVQTCLHLCINSLIRWRSYPSCKSLHALYLFKSPSLNIRWRNFGERLYLTCSMAWQYNPRSKIVVCDSSLSWASWSTTTRSSTMVAFLAMFCPNWLHDSQAP